MDDDIRINPTTGQPEYRIYLTGDNIDRIQKLIEYCGDDKEFQDLCVQIEDNVEIEGVEVNSEDWVFIQDIPTDILQEFDNCSSHVCRDAFLVEEAINPVLVARYKYERELYARTKSEQAG